MTMQEPTRGQKKLRVQFERLLKEEPFKDEVKRVRQALMLPRSGDRIGSKEFETEYEQETRALVKMLPAQNDHLLRTLRNYLLYDKRSFDDVGDVCEIEDARSESERYYLNEDSDSRLPRPQDYNDQIAYFLNRYPIAVRIHRGASQRAVVDFIEKNWGEISANQKFFSEGERSPLKNGRTRVKKNDRDEFIYDHLDMPRKQLAKLVRDTFGGEDVDANDVGKIIFLEKKRRKKV